MQRLCLKASRKEGLVATVSRALNRVSHPSPSNAEAGPSVQAPHAQRALDAHDGYRLGRRNVIARRGSPSGA